MVSKTRFFGAKINFWKSWLSKLIWCWTHFFTWTQKMCLIYLKFDTGWFKCAIGNLIDLNRYSSVSKLYRVATWVCRFIPNLKIIIKRVFYTWNFVPGQNHPCLWWNVSYVYTFLPRWNFILGWTHLCQKDRDEVSSRDEKKKKRHVNTSCRDEILKWACFFF